MSIEDVVNVVFSRLAAGELAEPPSPVQDGWQMDLPSGRTVARSTLQAEAGALIALGRDAVPHLLPWVMNDQTALRYVAIYALEQITGQTPHIPYFDRADSGGNRIRAIEAWRRWFDVSDKNAGHVD
jgi:hypothetical protein